MNNYAPECDRETIVSSCQDDILFADLLNSLERMCTVSRKASRFETDYQNYLRSLIRSSHPAGLEAVEFGRRSGSQAIAGPGGCFVCFPCNTTITNCGGRQPEELDRL